MPEQTRPARGMRDFLPDDVRRRDYVIGVVEGVYRRYGFEPLETPALENIETLTGKYGDEGAKLIFKVLRRGEHEASGETDLALRYDLTVPLARVVAEHRGKLPRFFKRYQIQPVWRADRPARGRFREFYQCDVDAIGSRSPVVEAEVCAAVSDVLHALGFSDFVIRLNHRGLLRGMLESFGVPAELHDQALVAVDKLDKIGADGVRTELAARGIGTEAIDRLLKAYTPAATKGSLDRRAVNAGRLERAAALVAGHADGEAAVANLGDIVRLGSATSASAHMLVDPSLARGLSYYTGAIMEIAVPDLAGSLGGGGRYDGLIGMFSGEDLPACGFSLGLERILVVMTERSMFPPSVQAAAADVLVTLFDEEGVAEALRLAGDLRAAGIRVEVYPDLDKLGKQFKYASARGLRYVTVVGGDERAAGQVTVKNMESGEQAVVARDQAPSWLAARTSNLEPRTSNLEPRTSNLEPRTSNLLEPSEPSEPESMTHPLGTLARTHTCGALTAADVGKDVVLLGWVHRIRDLGSLVFIDIRDRHGITQVVVRDDEALVGLAERFRAEYVIAVLGHVEARSPETVNPKVSTGAIEVRAREIRQLNDAKTPPFSIADESPVSEDTRLKYRYLDLRRSRMQQNLVLRHRVTMEVRKYFDEQGFLEIETPMLAKSTPEGARDYLVPSRVHPGEFYALPQSPQIFKQILMISGLDRYFQIVKCFRDEDLRADRQPEFTQVDLEMSFATEDLVFATIEPLMERLMALIGRETPRPFLRMPYAEAIARYGSDKPDLRCGMEICDLSDAFRDSGFSVFRGAIESGGEVRGFVVPGAARYSRRELDELVEQAKQLGAAGLVWARAPEGAVQSPALKAAGEDAIRRALDIAKTASADLLLMAAGMHEPTSKLLGTLRLQLARRESLLDPTKFAFLWVVDFPMFEWSEEEQHYEFMHHPFTSPLESDAELLESDQGRARARAYDLVLNGSEIAGGSIRIHDQALQRLIFKLLQISDEEARTRFGFFLEALEYGTPPHGGIALGLDRVVAILCGESSIREVIAFPKTAQAVDLMADAPSTVSPRQLRELHLKTNG